MAQNHPSILADLDFNKKRLAYFESQMDRYLAQASEAKKSSKAPETITQWVEIYSERVRKLERQVQKQGLRTELFEKTKSRSSRA